jgi:hypothetical protein
MNGMTDFEQLLYKELQEIRKELGALRTSLAVHKVKSGLWGSVGGALTVGLALFVDFLKGMR